MPPFFVPTREPLISIVVAVRNGEATLGRCLDGIATQGYRNRELIVIDGASTDGTVDILRRHGANVAFWCSEPDRGIYHAWNKGLAHTRGEWICFLGADDFLWAPDVLERVAPELARAYPPVRVVYGQVAVVNEQGAEMARAGEDWNSAKQRFPQIMCLPHTGLMHHRSLFDAHGAFDESYRIGGDYEMLLRELRRGEAQFVPGLVVAGMQHGGISSDPAGSVKLLREFRRAQCAHGMPRAGRHWMTAYAKAQLRVWLWRLLGRRVASRVFDLGRLISGKDAYWTRQ
jgi:glycosyltransferase involved in cell wall biosynthesis